MNPRPAVPAAGLGDVEVARLQRLLDGLPAPLEPLDVSALDGYLCAVLLQPKRPDEAAWLPWVIDADGRPPPPGCTLRELRDLVRRRLAELDRAIAQRQWFDPWVFELEGPSAVTDSVLPWVAGFAMAMDRFAPPTLGGDPRLVEPLAVLYLHFEDEDLEDAEELLETIATLEPPADLAEAVQDLVSSVLRIADVTRPAGPSAPGLASPPQRPRGARHAAQAAARKRARAR